MSWLLDTHVWVWSQVEPGKAGPRTTAILSDPLAVLHVATVSTLEVARLAREGRLHFRVPVENWVDGSVDLLSAVSLELTHGIAAEACQLPEPFHRDPADPILVATARRRNLRLITADQRILDYPHVETLDANL
ncbi:MAG: type II toxin-antitoxin system VapC family toxin [Candidatus Eremiobacterota bacterium]